MNWLAAPVALVPEGVVTVTFTVPAEPAGAVAVIDVALLTVKLVAGVEPNSTAVAPVKLVPVIATEVPPAVEPDEGLRPVTVGTASVTLNCTLVMPATTPPEIGAPDPPPGVCTALMIAKRTVVPAKLLTLNDAVVLGSSVVPGVEATMRLPRNGRLKFGTELVGYKPMKSAWSPDA